MPRLKKIWLLYALVLACASQVQADDSQPVDERLPVPAATELRKATEASTLQFADKSTGKPNEAQQAGVADALLELADKNETDPIIRYAALDRAYEIGVELGYPILMARAADKLAAAYQVKAAALVAAGYQRALEYNHAPNVYRDIAREAVFLARRLAAAEDFRQAKRLTELACSAAAQSKSKRVQQHAESADAAMAGCSRLFAEYTDAAPRLAAKPDDPSANLAVGAYLSFVKDDWQHGLPALAKGSDRALAALAKQTLEARAGSEGQLQLADQWWSVAAAADQPRKDAAQSLAVAFYYAALPGLKDEQQAAQAVALVRDWSARHPESPVVASIFSHAPDATKLAASNPPKTPSAPAGSAAGSSAKAKPATRASTGRLQDYPALDATLAEHVKQAIDAGRVVDTPRSGSGGSEFRDVPPEGALVIAIVLYWRGEYEKVSGVQPIYLTAQGVRRGPIFGLESPRSGISKAKIGYALGGVRIPEGAVLEGTEVVMMRLQGQSLNPGDNHHFRTRAGPTTPAASTTMAMDGSLVVGITGSVDKGGLLSSFGLVTLR